jgi:hypothetical protein
MERIGLSNISNKVIHSKERGIISTVIERCDDDRQCACTPNRVDVFGSGITSPGRADMSHAAAGPCRLQLCAVLRSSGIKLSEYICWNGIEGQRYQYVTLYSVKHSFNVRHPRWRVDISIYFIQYIVIHFNIKLYGC